MITIRFINSSDKKSLAMLRERGPAIVNALTRTMDSLMIALQRKIVTEKLQGQVLQQRRGSQGLAGSIQALRTTIQGGSVVGRVTGAGGIHWYGKVHEYGGKGSYIIEPVNKKALANVKSGWGPYRRVVHPPLPKRPFMAPSLEEMRDEIKQRLRDAIQKAAKGA